MGFGFACIEIVGPLFLIYFCLLVCMRVCAYAWVVVCVCEGEVTQVRGCSEKDDG